METPTPNPAINTAPAKKNFWTGKMENKDDCLKIIKEASYTFFFLASLDIIISFFVPIAVWVDGLLFLLLGLVLFFKKSRTAAVLLLVLSTAELAFTFVSLANATTQGTNIILAIILFWASIRAVQATFKLQKLKKLQQQTVT